MSVRCLLVDDNEDFLRAARVLLEREDIDVVGTASTGGQALRACRRLKPDVALVDIDLGAETGFTITRHLAGQTEAECPRVILVSADAADDFADLIAESPAVSFLPKTDLSGAAIRDILARSSPSAPRPHRDSR